MSAVLATAMVFGPVAYADSLDAQIAALNSQLSASQQQAESAHSSVNTLAGAVAQLNAQISSVQLQLELNQTKQAQTQARINDAQAQLATKTAILDESIRAIYQQGQVSPLEMLASSKSFSDYVDKQQYDDQIKDHIQDEMAAVNALKTSLEQQQAALNVQVSQEAGLSATLETQRQQQAQLLAAAQGSASQADATVAAQNAQVAKLQQEQAAALAAASRSFGGTIPGASGGSGGSCDNGHGNGGYPAVWCAADQDSLVDNWGMYNRECVSWAAWRRSNIGRPVPGGWGNANQWASAARAAGFRVDNTPEVGAVAQTSAGPYGHVAIVEAVQGSTVIVSEMNYDDAGHYRLGAYSTSYFDYIH